MSESDFIKSQSQFPKRKIAKPVPRLEEPDLTALSLIPKEKLSTVWHKERREFTLIDMMRDEMGTMPNLMPEELQHQKNPLETEPSESESTSLLLETLYVELGLAGLQARLLETDVFHKELIAVLLESKLLTLPQLEEIANRTDIRARQIIADNARELKLPAEELVQVITQMKHSLDRADQGWRDLIARHRQQQEEEEPPPRS